MDLLGLIKLGFQLKPSRLYLWLSMSSINTLYNDTITLCLNAFSEKNITYRVKGLQLTGALLVRLFVVPSINVQVASSKKIITGKYNILYHYSER